MSEKIMDAIQNKILPIATKIGNQRFLVALRDSFIGTMPVVMTGSIALLLNAFFGRYSRTVQLTKNNLNISMVGRCQ